MQTNNNRRPYPNAPTPAERRRHTAARLQTIAAALALGIATAAAVILLAAATL